MLYQLNYIHHIWDCKCTDYFRNTKNNLQEPGVFFLSDVNRALFNNALATFRGNVVLHQA